MRTYNEVKILPYTPEQLYALVVDVEKYPEFIPWCRAARIVSREKDSFLGELIVSFSHLTERYTSRVVPVAPSDTNEGRIDVSLVSGPFHHLNNHWRFVPPDYTARSNADRWPSG
jgi:coenzyme Q-binding protein COQ10